MAFGAELPCGPNVGISDSRTHLQGEAVGGQAIQKPESCHRLPRGYSWCKETWETWVGSSLEGLCKSQMSSSKGLLRGVSLLSLCRDGDWWTVLSEGSGRVYSVPSIHVAKISHG